jgi:uncharacterized membrane protein YuzA (DUF378 family)
MDSRTTSSSSDTGGAIVRRSDDGIGSALAILSLVLLIVGGLNWALVGLFNFDLVAALFGEMSLVSRTVYVLVGLAAIYALTLFPRLTRSNPRTA